MIPAAATPSASGYKTASEVVVTGTEPAAPEDPPQNDDDYVRVPRETIVSVDNGRTETVRHQVPQNAGPQNATPFLQSVPVHLPAPASQHSCGASSTILNARVSV